MLVSVAEYDQLPKGLQSALLLQSGIPLMSRMMGTHYLVLFSLNNFFVEASWDSSHELKHVHAFRNTSELTPYLARINWEELA